MQTGKLNRPIQFLSQSTTQDATGQQVQTWTTFYNCFAQVDIVRGQLVYSTAEFVAKASLVITTRYTSTQIFNVGQRIQFQNLSNGNLHTYEIEYISNPLEQNKWLQFYCYELQNI